MMAEPVAVVFEEEAGEGLRGDWPCGRCGYNLRGLREEGQCPECGVAVWLSVSGSLLRYSDVGWVEGLRRGAVLAWWGWWGMIAVTGLGMFVPASAVTARGVVGLAGQAAMLVGWWLLTRRDPRVAGERGYGTARRLTRVFWVCAIGAAVTYLVGWRMQWFSRGTVQWIRLAGQLATLAAVVAQFAHLRGLAARVPDFRVAERATVMMYLAAGLYAVRIELGLLVGGEGPIGEKSELTATVVGFVAGGIVAFGVLTAVYMATFTRFGELLRHQVRKAREAVWVEGRG